MSDITTQARQLQEQLPELYAYLQQRDSVIERGLARIPSRADFELAAVFDVSAHLDETLRELPPGIGDLCESGDEGHR
jgi:hypothetical protein